MCLAGCAIPAPVPMELGTPVQLDCHINIATSQIQLRNASGLSTAPQLHLHATLTSVSQQAVLLEHGCSSACRTSCSPVVLAWLALVLGCSQPAAGPALGCSIRCCGDISLKSDHGSGWVAHPAIADNALQLGPATSDVGSSRPDGMTRVVAGVEAYVATKRVR